MMNFIHGLRAKAPYILALLTALALASCKAQQPIVPDHLAPPTLHTAGPIPTYRALVSHYNRNIRLMSQLWAHTEVQMHWRDDKGKRHVENGEGVLIIIRPLRIALTIGKLGHTGLWAGGNEQRYWLFNLQDDIAYTGRYKNLGKPCSQPLPLPVQPQAVPYLLGIMPIDADDVPAGDAVTMRDGYAVIQPPGLLVRLWLNPHTAEPARIDLLNAQGKSVVVARLSQWNQMEIRGLPPSKLPDIAHLINIYAPGHEALLRLELHDVSDGKAKQQIHPGVFDWHVLVQANHPKKIVNLDKKCR